MYLKIQIINLSIKWKYVIKYIKEIKINRYINWIDSLIDRLKIFFFVGRYTNWFMANIELRKIDRWIEIDE